MDQILIFGISASAKELPPTAIQYFILMQQSNLDFSLHIYYKLLNIDCSV